MRPFLALLGTYRGRLCDCRYILDFGIVLPFINGPFRMSMYGSWEAWEYYGGDCTKEEASYAVGFSVRIVGITLNEIPNYQGEVNNDRNHTIKYNGIIGGTFVDEGVGSGTVG